MMKTRILHILLIILQSIILSSYTNIGDKTNSNNYSLFKIERSKDPNEIFYDINLTQSGKLDIENPIDVYWIMHTDGEKTEPLTWIQKKLAYGLNFSSICETDAKFRFVSVSNRDFIVKKNKDGIYKVYTYSKDKEVTLNKIFVQIDGGTFWVPNITKVELHTTEVKTGRNTIEIINP